MATTEHTQPMEVTEDRTPASSTRWMLTVWPNKLGHTWSPDLIVVPRFNILYMAWGFEYAPTTNEEHWHVYIRLNRKIRFDQLKRALDNTIHIEGARGSEKQCRDYCWSQGDYDNKRDLRISFAEKGTFNENMGIKGKRNDLTRIVKAIQDDGATIPEIASNYGESFIRYHNGIEAFARQVRPPPPVSRDVQVLFLYGPTGTGKTHRVLSEYPNAFVALPGKNVWDEYKGEEVLLFDEWRDSDWPITMMNKYLDKWRMTLQCRYRNSYAAWTLVILCTNDSPAQAYAMEPNPMMRQAFQRRIAGRCFFIEKREDEGGPPLKELLQTPPLQ